MADAQPGPSEDELVRVLDDLIAQAADLRRGWEELEAAVQRALPRTADAPEAQDGGPAPQEEADPRRLVALDMALAGRTRDEVATYLERRFGAADVEDILDEVFTPG